MPDALSGRGVEGNQRVGKEVVAKTIPTVKIECCRSSGHEDDPALRVHRHAAPVVGRADIFPRIFGPSVVAEFPRPRDRVKGPTKLARVDIKCTNIAGRRGKCFREAPPNYDQILVDGSGTGE